MHSRHQLLTILVQEHLNPNTEVLTLAANCAVVSCYQHRTDVLNGCMLDFAHMDDAGRVYMVAQQNFSATLIESSRLA